MRKRVAIACWLVVGVTVALVAGSTTVAVLSDEETVPVDVSVAVPETPNGSDGGPPGNGSDPDPADPVSPPDEPPGNGSITLPVEPPENEDGRENGSTTRPVEPHESGSENG